MCFFPFGKPRAMEKLKHKIVHIPPIEESYVTLFMKKTNCSYATFTEFCNVASKLLVISSHKHGPFFTLYEAIFAKHTRVKKPTILSKYKEYYKHLDYSEGVSPNQNAMTYEFASGQLKTVKHYTIKCDLFQVTLLDCMLDVTFINIRNEIKFLSQLPTSIFQAFSVLGLDLLVFFPNAEGFQIDLPSYVFRSVTWDFVESMAKQTSFFTRTVEDDVVFLGADAMVIYYENEEKMRSKTIHSYAISILCFVWSERICDIWSSEHKNELNTENQWTIKKIYISLKEFLIRRCPIKKLPFEIHLVFYAILLFFSLDHYYTYVEPNVDRVSVDFYEKIGKYNYKEIKNERLLLFIDNMVQDGYKILNLCKFSFSIVSQLAPNKTYKKDLRSTKLVHFHVERDMTLIQNDIEAFCFLQSELPIDTFDTRALKSSEKNWMSMSFPIHRVSPMDLVNSVRILIRNHKEDVDQFFIYYNAHRSVCLLPERLFLMFTRYITMDYIHTSNIISRRVQIPTAMLLLHNFCFGDQFGRMLTVKAMLNMFCKTDERRNENGAESSVFTKVLPHWNEPITQYYGLLPHIMGHVHDYTEMWKYMQSPFWRDRDISIFNRQQIVSVGRNDETDYLESLVAKIETNKKLSKNERMVFTDSVDFITDFSDRTIYTALEAFFYLNTKHCIDTDVLNELKKWFRESESLRTGFPFLNAVLVHMTKYHHYYLDETESGGEYEASPTYSVIYLPTQWDNKEHAYPFPTHCLFYELIASDALPSHKAMKVFISISLIKDKRKKGKPKLVVQHSEKAKQFMKNEALRLENHRVKLIETCKNIEQRSRADKKRTRDLLPSQQQQLEFDEKLFQIDSSCGTLWNPMYFMLFQMEILSFYRCNYITKTEKMWVTGAMECDIKPIESIQYDTYRGLIDWKPITTLIPLHPKHILNDNYEHITELPLDYDENDQPLDFGKCLPIWRSEITNVRRTFSASFDKKKSTKEYEDILNYWKGSDLPFFECDQDMCDLILLFPVTNVHLLNIKKEQVASDESIESLYRDCNEHTFKFDRIVVTYDLRELMIEEKRENIKTPDDSESEWISSKRIKRLRNSVEELIVDNHGTTEKRAKDQIYNLTFGNMLSFNNICLNKFM